MLLPINKHTKKQQKVKHPRMPCFKGIVRYCNGIAMFSDINCNGIAMVYILKSILDLFSNSQN